MISMTSPAKSPVNSNMNPNRSQDIYEDEDLLATLKVDDFQAKEEFNDRLSLLSSRVCPKTSTGQDAPSVKLRKRCSIRRFLSGGNNNGKSKENKSENPEVKRSLSLTNDAVSKKSEFVPTVFVERSKSFSLPWTNPTMTHETEVRKRNSSGPVCVQRQPRIGGKSLFTYFKKLHLLKLLFKIYLNYKSHQHNF